MLIAIDGLDGSGLSTQVNLLASWLSQQGKRIAIGEIPSAGLIGGLIKGKLANEWRPDKTCLRLLFAADTHNLYHSTFETAMKEGKIAICERYILSALAWGSMDFDKEWLKELYNELPPPDVTFYIKTSPRTGIKRLGQYAMLLKFFDHETHLNKVAENFDELANRYSNVKIIDGEQSIQKVHADIIAEVKKMLR